MFDSQKEIVRVSSLVIIGSSRQIHYVPSHSRLFGMSNLPSSMNDSYWCLDSIIHAEHKGILEEMRLDYSLTHLQEGTRREEIYKERFISQLEDQTFPNGRHLGLDFLGIRRNIFAQNLANEQEIDEFGSLTLSCDRSRVGESRVAVATRFQRTFMKLLRNAEFEELSVRDLQLRSALNTDYLLTLPIFVDWKKASESNAIIFRRGYAAERQRGLLLVEKLDYLQSKFLQELFRNLSKPLKKVGIWINETWCRIGDMEQFQVLFKGIRSWLKTPSRLKELFSENERSSHGDPLGAELQSDSDLPIWLAAQKAVSRYEDFLSSVGPREILFRKLLVWSGFLPALPTVSVVLDCESTISEPHLRPNFLPRVSLSDIWKPATSESCGNDIVKMLKAAISVLFSQSILQEPAFEELILLYTDQMDHTCGEGCDELPSLELKIYERIPLPDLPVIFPHKRLSFRILDTLRLDIASILGLLAYFVNYKFEDILSSPSAFLLDTIAISALIIYVTRVALGYKQTWDRYQLLVNKTLYEKTLASGFGSVHFLVDASEQQQYKEAILAYVHLLKADRSQRLSRSAVGDTCERFIYDIFGEKVEMPIEKAVETLIRLGLVEEVFDEGNTTLHALSCSKAYEALKQRWDCLL
ncbi:hypothetical protein AMTR_s00018p00182200 [Amborella trichopoda]|uniref:Uncharacterized protein n=2 Tax=Amborella trichopoda TaxID=13333 RepID=W1PM41_AMBTC|nr:hypothetical protein AMTR_s00018p00182200 [Amborella trichopoda]